MLTVFKADSVLKKMRFTSLPRPFLFIHIYMNLATIDTTYAEDIMTTEVGGYIMTYE